MTDDFNPRDYTLNQDLLDVMKAFSLTIAFRARYKSSDGHLWWLAEIYKLIGGKTDQGVRAEIVSINFGYALLTSTLINELAAALECSQDAMIETCRRMIEQTFPDDA